MAGVPGKNPTATQPSAALGTDAERRAPSRAVVIEDSAEVRRSLPRLAPNAPFLVACHPDRWSAGTDGLLLPEFAYIRIAPGVNGVRYREGRPPAWQPTASAWRERGFTVIESRDGPGGEPYCRATEVEGGIHHHLPFVTLYDGTTMHTTDRTAMKAWVDDLVKRGVIPGPSIVSLQRELRVLRQSHRRAASRAKVSAEHEAEAEALGRAVSAIEAYLTKSAKPTPAKGGAAAPPPEE